MIRFVPLSDLEADIELQVLNEWRKWRYVTPPRIIFEPSHGSPFLPGSSNKRESILPKY